MNVIELTQHDPADVLVVGGAESLAVEGGEDLAGHVASGQQSVVLGETEEPDTVGIAPHDDWDEADLDRELLGATTVDPRGRPLVARSGVRPVGRPGASAGQGDKYEQCYEVGDDEPVECEILHD